MTDTNGVFTDELMNGKSIHKRFGLCQWTDEAGVVNYDLATAVPPEIVDQLSEKDKNIVGVQIERLKLLRNGKLKEKHTYTGLTSVDKGLKFVRRHDGYCRVLKVGGGAAASVTGWGNFDDAYRRFCMLRLDLEYAHDS